MKHIINYLRGVYAYMYKKELLPEPLATPFQK